MVHLGYLNYTQYQINVSFKGLENITYEVKVNFMVSSQHTGWKTCLNCKLAVSEDASHPTDTHSGFELQFSDTFLSPLSQWKMYNPSFSQVEIWFRFVFVVLTFMVTVRDLCN